LRGNFFKGVSDRLAGYGLQESPFKVKLLSKIPIRLRVVGKSYNMLHEFSIGRVHKEEPDGLMEGFANGHQLVEAF
jgi:hypothetical protein